MEIDLDDWEKLPGQSKVYNDTKSKIIMFSGGLGCISESTEIETINGSIACGDIQSGQAYFSRNAQGKCSLFPGTAPYPKGKANLYRVIHERGEFVSSAKHLICASDGTYQPLEAFLFGRYSEILSPTSQDNDLLRSALSDQSLKQKALDFLDGCAGYIRQYGQRLRSSKADVLSFHALPFDAHKLDHIFQGLCGKKRQLSQAERKQSRNHLYELSGHQPMQGYTHHQVVPVMDASFQGCDAKHFEHILQSHLISFLSHGSSLFRHLKDQLRPLSAQSIPSCLFPTLRSCHRPFSRILSIEKLKSDWFFDLHVFGSNNYLSGGAYHHNSGKTRVLCRKVLQLSALNAGYPGAILAPSYKDFRRDIKPEMQEILLELGLKEKKHWKFHASFFEYRFCWSPAPIYVLSGEQPIAGPNLAFCVINEHSLIKYERIKEMLRRVRVKNAPKKQRFMAGTPEDVHGWLPDFVELQENELKKDNNAFSLVYADTRENTFLDPDYRAHLSSMLDDQAMRVFAEGQIIRMGTDYFYYAYNDDVNVSEVNQIPGDPIYANLDFNVGRMSASFANVVYESATEKKPEKVLKIFSEVVLKGDSDTPKLGEYIKTRYGTENVILTIDASGKNRKTTGPSDLKALIACGFPKENIRFNRSNPRMRKRQLLVNGLFSKRKIIIDRKCKELRKDLKTIKQNQHDFTKDKRDPERTHMSDGLDYFVDLEFNLGKDFKSYTRQL